MRVITLQKKKTTVLPLGNSSRPRPYTVASKTNVLKVREVNKNNEGYIRRDIPKPVDVSLLQQIKTLQFKKKNITRNLGFSSSKYKFVKFYI